MLALSYVWVYFHRMAPAVVSGDLIADFKITASQLGSLAAMYYYISALTQIPSGIVADVLGARIVVTAANLVAGIGSVVFGLALTFGEATLGRFLVGLGVSVVFVCFMKSNAVWFDAKQYGFISGLTLLIGNGGSIFAGSPLELLLRTYSWRSVFVAIGVVSIVLAAASALAVRNSPAQRGEPWWRAGAPSRTAADAGWAAQLRSVLRNRYIWPSFAVNLGLLGSLYSFSGLWAIPYLHDVRGLPRSDGAALVTASLVGLALGSFCLGWLSDALGRRKPVLVGSVLLYVGVFACLTMLHAGDAATALLFFLLGFSGGGFVLTYALAKEIGPVAQAGMAVAVVNTGVFLGASLIQPLYGLILDRAWSGQLAAGVRAYSPAAYAAANAFMLGAAILALGAALAVKETCAGREAAAPQ